jgi:hypothetical protein
MLLLICTSAFALTHLTNCTVIENSGFYVIDSNLQSNYTCLSINVDNVDIDGNSKTLIGNQSHPHYGINATDRVNITVRNMNISNFSYGILYWDTNNSIIENCSISDSKNHGVWISVSQNDVIMSNSVKHNGNNAFQIATSTSNYLINNLMDGKINTFISTNTNMMYNNSWGKINWTDLAFVDAPLITGNLTNESIVIRNNSVFVNSTAFAGQNINSSGMVTLYGVTTFTTPVIYLDGTTVCNEASEPSCYNFTSLNSGTVVFNVSHWSSYSIGEGTPTASGTVSYPLNLNNTEHTLFVFMIVCFGLAFLFFVMNGAAPLAILMAVIGITFAIMALRGFV